MTTFVPSTSTDSSTGRVKWNTRFVSLPGPLLTHETFSELSGGSAKLLLALSASYMGNNNGHLTATFAHMAKFGFNSKSSLAKAIRELLDFGYIVRTRSQHHRSPALYAITWLPIAPAPKGEPYDRGITLTGEASDLWREIDLSMTAGMAGAPTVTPDHTAEALH